MTSGRRIALLGSINRDTIRTPDGVETESYGGLLYTILPLAEIASAGTAILPIYDAGVDVEEPVRQILGDYPNVSLEGLSFGPWLNTHCVLDYAADGIKQETLVEVGRTVSLDRLADLADVDAMLLNFITGFELELESLQAFRGLSDATVFMDFHSLTLGIDAKRQRFWRRPDDWEAWTACADVVQMNRQEAALLADRVLATGVDWFSFAEQVLETGPRCCVVTGGEEGSVAWFRENGHTAVDAVPAMPDGDPVDPTGCGDAFLAGFAWRHLETDDYREANRFANRVAGIVSTLRGIEEMREIGRQLKL